MTISYAPFDDAWAATPPSYVPPEPKHNSIKLALPISDNTECNYIVMFFIGGVILMGIMDSLRR
jgi:hypothetical protein